MTQVVQASELTLHEVKTQLGLQEAEDEQFSVSGRNLYQS